MKISLDWLQEFVTWEGSPTELADKLTGLGLNIESLTEHVQTFPGVTVAKVLAVRPHPDADRLRLCSVHDGHQTIEVVCGAPNVRADQHVLLATPGAVLPGAGTIRKAKIRGVESHGMICSETELGLGRDAGGIMELDASSRPGQPADDLFGYHDWVLDIEVTPNRPDWLSHVGIAREVAALNGTKITLPAVWSAKKSGVEQIDMNVEIEDFADCPRYTAHEVREVTVGPSPAFMQNRLRAIGARPINNVVDITNYVLFEMGQPLHAFDRAKLAGGRLFVRRAAAGTSLVTLDGSEHRLSPEHLIIADSSGAVALAGIMGGLASEVDENTREILLESAFFSPRVVRRGARTLQVASESSYRFEREADWEMVERAAHRALHLLRQYAGAHIVRDWIDRQNPDRPARPVITLRSGQVNRLLGTDLGTPEMAGLLQRLNLKVVPLGKASERKRNGASVVVEVPSFRRDLSQEVDLAEEIARLYGYDHIPERGRLHGGLPGVRRPLDQACAGLRNYLVSCGYSELATSSFLARADLERLQLPPGDRRRECLTIINPRHGGDVLLRTSLLPSLLKAVRHNVHADNPLPLRLFQINKIFLPAQGPPVDARHSDEGLLPRESLLLQIGLAGLAGAGLGGVREDLLEIRGIVESLAQLLGRTVALAPKDCEPFLESGLQWVLADERARPLGTAGAVSRSVLSASDLDVPLAVAEIELERLDLSVQVIRYQPFSRYPGVKRDLSLVVTESITYAQIADVVHRESGPSLESLELFDIYKGKGLPKNSQAVGIRLKFRSDKGNLKGSTVDKILEKVTRALAETLNAHLRA